MSIDALSGLSPADMGFLKRLHDLDPRWSFFRDDLSGGQLTAELPCPHPSVQRPLRVVVGGQFSMSWYAGVFFEARSLSLTAWSDALVVVSGLLDETIWHAVAYDGEQAVSLGTGRQDDWKKWHPCFDRLEIKTWRGRGDLTVLIKEGQQGYVSLRNHANQRGGQDVADGPTDTTGPLA